MRKALSVLIALVLSLTLAAQAQAATITLPGSEISDSLDFTVDVTGTYLDQLNAAASPADVATVMARVIAESSVPSWASEYATANSAHRTAADQLIYSQASQRAYTDTAQITPTIHFAALLGTPTPSVPVRMDTPVPATPATWGDAYAINNGICLIKSAWANTVGNHFPHDGAECVQLRVYRATTEFDITPVNVGDWAYRMRYDAGTWVWDALLLTPEYSVLGADITNTATNYVYYNDNGHWAMSAFKIVDELPSGKQLSLRFDPAHTVPVSGTITVDRSQSFEIGIVLSNNSPVAVHKGLVCIVVTDDNGNLINPSAAGLTITYGGGTPVTWDGQYCHWGPATGSDILGFSTGTTILNVTIATPGKYVFRMVAVQLP